VGGVDITNADKPNALNELFSSCFNSSLTPLNIDDWNNIITDQEHYPTDLLCTNNEVFDMLCSLNVNKSNGPDEISACMLKSCAASIYLTIKILFYLNPFRPNPSSMESVQYVTPIPKSSGSGTPSGFH